MAQEIPENVKQWKVSQGSSFDESLKFSVAPLPELGDSQVLVKCEQAVIS
jgi:hypothetical protein